MWGKQEFQSFNSKSLLLLSIQGPTAQNSNDVALNSPLYSMKHLSFLSEGSKCGCRTLTLIQLGIFLTKEFAFAMYLKRRMEGLCVCRVFLSWDELQACLGLEIDHHPH